MSEGVEELIIPAGKFNAGRITLDEYRKMYADSLNNADAFWAEQAKRLDWMRPWQTVDSSRFSLDVSIKWFEGGMLNVCYNCVDRHLATKANDTAIIWEGDNPADSKHITYQELHEQVCRLASVLKRHGVRRGDRVIIYMPMIPEGVYAMLACARIGAVHSVVFGGFSAAALKGRIGDCGAVFLITADEGVRGGRYVPLKQSVDEALQGDTSIRNVLVARRTGNKINMQPGRDLWYDEEVASARADVPCEAMEAEDPLFILYTSGSTGKPKGVLHTTAGYLLYAAFTHEMVFDYRPGEVYWCTADIGWVTGHSYAVYGSLANGGATLIFEGVPTYPDYSRLWQVVDKHNVSILYTAPTLIRALEREGEGYVRKTSRKSLRILGSVGEPINPEAWLWYYKIAGEERAPVIDTWWQTETGGIMITPLPGVTDLKPGYATLPFFGVKPVLLDDNGSVLEGVGEGNLCIASSHPGQARTIYNDHERFERTYFSQFKGYYCTGDGAKRDNDGYYRITGRVDDVINVSGHRLGTAEIESALTLHSGVTEAAVVGMPHAIKGQGIYAFVTLASGLEPGDKIKQELEKVVVKEIGAIARPDIIQWARELPKTRSGKIMRRILRKIAADDCSDLGDTSTLLSPESVNELIKGRLNL